MNINRNTALQNLKLLLDHPLEELSVNDKGRLYLSKKRQELVLYAIKRTFAFAEKMEFVDRLFVPTDKENLYASAGHVFKKVHQFFPSSHYTLEEKVEKHATLKLSYAGKEYVVDKENFIHNSRLIRNLLKDIVWTEKDKPIPLDVLKRLDPTERQLKNFLKLCQDETENPIFSYENVLVYIKMADALDVPHLIERLTPLLYIWLDQDTLLDLIEYHDSFAITLLSKLPHHTQMKLLLTKEFSGEPQPKRARIIPVLFIIECINRNHIPLSEVVRHCPIHDFFTLLGEAAQRLKYIELNLSDATSQNFDLVLTNCPNVTTLIFNNIYQFPIDHLERVGSLQYLRELEIKSGKDSSLDTNCLRGCSQLRKLSLTSFTLVDGNLGVIEALPYLEELHLKKLKGFLPITLFQIASKTRLRSLTLHHLQMAEDFLEHLTPLINLEILSLSFQTPCSGLAPLAKMTRLRELSLLFIETQMDSLPKLPSLRVLRITSNYCITSLNFLKDREQLRELSLACLISLPEDAVQEIRNLKKITSLSLERFQLRNEHLSFLTELLELETLSLIDIHGVDAGITPILFTLPNLKRVTYKGEAPLKLSFVQVEKVKPFQGYFE